MQRAQREHAERLSNQARQNARLLQPYHTFVNNSNVIDLFLDLPAATRVLESRRRANDGGRVLVMPVDPTVSGWFVMLFWCT